MSARRNAPVRHRPLRKRVELLKPPVCRRCGSLEVVKPWLLCAECLDRRHGKGGDDER